MASRRNDEGMMSDPLPTIAVIGGTGAEGSGLALRWALAGYPVIIGSRDAARAEDAAAALEDRAQGFIGGPDDYLDAAEAARRAARPRTNELALCGMENAEAAAACHIAVLAVPLSAQLPTLESIREHVQGKILVDVTAPLRPPKVGTVQLPEGGSAVAAGQALLGEGVRVVSAFQNIAAGHLAEPDHEIDCDVLVCGNDKAAREIVIGLAEAAGMRGWHAGPLANSAAAEALTSVLIAINRAYRIPGSGIRITGAPAREED
jgi:NADPH-dependent F420 reductase